MMMMMTVMMLRYDDDDDEDAINTLRLRHGETVYRYLKCETETHKHIKPVSIKTVAVFFQHN